MLFRVTQIYTKFTLKTSFFKVWDSKFDWKMLLTKYFFFLKAIHFLCIKILNKKTWKSPILKGPIYVKKLQSNLKIMDTMKYNFLYLTKSIFWHPFWQLWSIFHSSINHKTRPKFSWFQEVLKWQILTLLETSAWRNL